MSWLISLAGKEAPTSDCQNVMIQRFSVDQQLVVLTPMALKCMVRNSKERELSEQSLFLSVFVGFFQFHPKNFVAFTDYGIFPIFMVKNNEDIRHKEIKCLDNCRKSPPIFI